MPSRMSAPLLAVVALAIGLAAPPTAQAAAAFDEVIKDYRDDAKIDPCQHSDQTLSDAAGQVPTDIEQYAPDFPEALGNAIAARAQGACEGKKVGGGSKETGGGPGANKPAPPGGSKPAPSGSGGSPGAAPPPAATPASPPGGAGNAAGSKQVPAPARPAASDSNPPVPFALLAVLAGLLALGGLLFAVRRWLGLDGHRIARARHTWGEAGFRAGGTWADFRDWLRVGR